MISKIQNSNISSAAKINRSFFKAAILFIIFISHISIAFSQFGMNKVQYQDFNWKYIESSHFNVYYTEGTKYLAEFMAIEAEKALVSIQNLLNYKLSSRVSFIVYSTHNEFQQTNVISQFMPEGVGGVTELFKNRIVVPFQGEYSQFRHTIHHELIHAVLNDMFYGGTFQSSLGSGGNFQIPLWMNEGLCEYASLGGLDVQTDMFIRDVTISENLPSLDRLSGYYAYRGGQSFYWYVAEKYGKERIGDLINRLRITRNVDAAFESAFHLNFKDFSEKWQKDIKKFYLPDLDKFKDLDEFSEQITDHRKLFSFYNTSPAISPDGEKMAFISDRKGTFGIYVQKLDDKENAKHLISSFRTQDFEDLNLLTPGISWNPKGTHIAISAKSGGEDAIFITDVKTEDYERLKFGIKSISSVSWSHDGKMLAFIGSVNEKTDIFIYYFDTKKIVNITDDVFSDMIPKWSPDSRRIYFVSDRGDNTQNDINKHNYKMWQHNFNQSDIYSIDIETRKITRITNEPEYAKPSFVLSPNETKMLYVSDKNGIGNIYELNFATGKSIPKTNSLNGISQLSLSTDGSKLLFSTLANNGYDIYLIRSPFEKNLDIDVLPLTKLRDKAAEQQKAANDVAAAATKDASSERDYKLEGYGEFEIDLSRQQVFQANPDVHKRPEKMQTESNQTSIVVSDSGFIEHDYKIKFTPDIILGNPSYNTFWGFQGVTQMLFSDVLGDHQIYAQANLLLDLRNSTFFVAYSYLPEIIDYQAAVYSSAGFAWRIDKGIKTIVNQQDTSEYDYLYRYRNYGAQISASFPFDLFNRVEWGLNFMNVSREFIQSEYLQSTNSYAPDPITPHISRFLIVPEGRYVHDDAFWGWYAPVKGTRYYIGFKGAPKLSKDGVGFMTIDGDFRYYIQISDFINFALRGAGGASFGPNPQRFFLGGTDNWINRRFTNDELPFDQPEDFAFMQFITPMRGFAISELTGSKYFLTNIEMRFPLFTALLAGPVPVLFQGIMGSLFLDVGGAWDDDFIISKVDEEGIRSPANLLMSAGVGIRTYAIGIPLKLDIAWRNEYNNWSQPEYMFSIGLDF